MPTYEYECTKCGEQFEYFQSIKDAPKDTCEKCSGPLVKLLSAGTGLIFKGSGFYITDYKTKAGEAGGSGEGAKGGSDGAKSGSDGSKGSGEGSKAAGGESKVGDGKATATPAAPPAEKK